MFLNRWVTSDVADEHEAAHSRVERVRRVDELRQQPRAVAPRTAHVAKDDDLRPLRPARSEDELVRLASGGEVLAQRPADAQAPAPADLAAAREARLQPLREPTHHRAHALHLVGGEGSEAAMPEGRVAARLWGARLLPAIGDPPGSFLLCLTRL